MPVSKAQQRAKARYDKDKLKRATVIFSPNETELYEHLAGHDSMSGYIKELIRRDMEAAGH